MPISKEIEIKVRKINKSFITRKINTPHRRPDVADEVDEAAAVRLEEEIRDDDDEEDGRTKEKQTKTQI